MHMVRHDDVAAQQIAIAIEVAECVFHNRRYFSVPEPALADSLIQVVFQLFTMLPGDLFQVILSF